MEIQNDQWFFDNGYFKKEKCSAGAFIYNITVSKEKWRELFDTCLAQTPKGHIITLETLIKTIESGNAIRKPKTSGYIKVTPEEKLRRVKEKQHIKALNVKIRERKNKNANRNIK